MANDGNAHKAVWRVGVAVVCLMAGLLLGTTYDVAGGGEIRSSDSTRLSDLVRTAQTTVDAAERDRDKLSAQLRAAQEVAASSDSDVAAALDSASTIEGAAGLAEISGAGLIVALTDAPRNADGKYPDGASPDDLVVHQQDVQSALNAVWAGGAVAVSLQDQRIINTSAPRCIGNTLLLHGRTYSPPYVLTAIGDASRMESALDAEPGIRIYRQYVVRFGLGYRLDRGADLTVPAYSGTVRAQFARPQPR